MITDDTLQNAAARVRGEASAARAFFHTWKTLEMAQGDAGLLAVMNDSRYADFFLASLAGNLRLFFISLGNVLDTDKRSLSIFRLRTLLGRREYRDLEKEIVQMEIDHRQTIWGIRHIRNKSIAHNSVNSVDSIFDAAAVTPNQIEALLDAICDIVNKITVKLGSPTSISEGKRNEDAVQNILWALSANRLCNLDVLEWTHIRPFFEEHGCMVSGKPEIRWYQASWAAMEAAGLTSSGRLRDIEVDLTTVKLRALCILAMYLGGYQAAGEYSDKLGGYFSEHEPMIWYLDSLNVSIEDIWTLARRERLLDTESSSYWEDSSVDIDQLCEIALDLAVDHREAIYRTLVGHYGSNEELFVSWWNSRLALDEDNSYGDIFAAAEPGDGTLEVWGYVQNGMRDFDLAD